MRRRALLGLLAGSVGLGAGCTGGGPRASTSSPTEQGPRRVPAGESVTVDGTRLTLAEPRVEAQVVANGPAHQVAVNRADHYVVLDATVDGPVPREVDLRSVVEGSVLDEAGPVPTAPDDGDAAPVDPAAWDRSPVAFPFPAGRHDRASVRWARSGERVHWALPTRVVEQLVAGAAFEVGALEVVERAGERHLALTVANEGSADGRFVAEVSFEAFSGSDTVAFEVPAGETRQHVVRPSVLLYLENDGGGTLTVRVPAEDGYETRELPVAVTETAGT